MPKDTAPSNHPEPASEPAHDPVETKAPEMDGEQQASKGEGAAQTGAPSDSDPAASGTGSPAESGEASEASQPSSPSAKDGETIGNDAPPLPNEAPPLPGGPPPAATVTAEDDGWDFHWDATRQAYFFHNRHTGVTTWENPRTSTAEASTSAAPGTAVPAASASDPPPLPTSSRPAAGGYNPAIHGDYDPNAWYAKSDAQEEEDPSASAAYFAGQQPDGATASFNRFTGQFQRPGDDPDRHSDAAKSHRQMNAFFDVDAAANAHDGRSLKAERSGKKISKSELKHFKEKRKARKEEKRRAWLRD